MLSDHGRTATTSPAGSGDRALWIVDFGVAMPEREAALYEAPYEYVKRYVKPERDENKRPVYRARWWIHGEPRPAMRAALATLPRYIATSRVSKHRIFTWLGSDVLPDSTVVAVASKSDYLFGVLHSRLHELWAFGMGTQLREKESGDRYTATSTFETFPFPWVPGTEPVGDARVEAVAAAARALVEQRDRWLNPQGATDADLKARTFTALYNACPTWLDLAHRRLDDAVLDAYGWPHDLGDEEILGRILALNLERADTTDPPMLPIKVAS